MKKIITLLFVGQPTPSAAQRITPLVIQGGTIVDRELHANYKNPIPAIRAGRSTPQEIDIAPRSLVQNASGTIKVSARRGFDKFHKVMLNGKKLDTQFINASQLEATVPAQLTKEVGTYPLIVIG